MAKANRNTRQVLVQHLGNPQLVGGIDDRPDQRDRNRLDFRFAEFLDGGKDAFLVKLLDHIAFCGHPFGDLERQRTGNIGFGIDRLHIVGVFLATFTGNKNVTEALGHDQGGARRLALKKRIRRGGGAEVDARQTLDDIVGCDAVQFGDQVDPVEKPLDDVGASRGRLVADDRSVFIRHDEIRERTTHVYREMHAGNSSLDF